LLAGGYFFLFLEGFLVARFTVALAVVDFFADLPNARSQLSEYFLFAPIRTIVTVCSPSLSVNLPTRSP
jgi:hypothetical protein